MPINQIPSPNIDQPTYHAMTNGTNFPARIAAMPFAKAAPAIQNAEIEANNRPKLNWKRRGMGIV